MVTMVLALHVFSCILWRLKVAKEWSGREGERNGERVKMR
jgi:hypothetical protein